MVGAVVFPTVVCRGPKASPMHRLPRASGPFAACLLLAACGGGGSASAPPVTVPPAAVTYTLGGTLSGLAAATSLTLGTAAGERLTLGANGAFVLPGTLAQGAAYTVRVVTAAAGQTCTVANGSGTVAAANVSNVAVTCTPIAVPPPSYALGGTLSGLPAGAAVTLLNAGGDPLTVAANGSFTFATRLTGGTAYAVSVGTPPSGANCTVSGGSGTVAGADVAGVAVSCSPSALTVGGTLSGLPAGQALLLTNNATDRLTATGNGAFTFPTALTAGASYAVAVAAAPTGLACTVSGGTGTVGSSNVTGVVIGCTPAIPPSGLSAAFGTVVWQDDFTHDAPGSPNSALWAGLSGNGAEYGVTGWGNNEAEYYLPANATVENGALAIHGKADASVAGHGCGDSQAACAYSSARLTSLATVDLGQPGLLEVRAQLPSATGSWPAIWLLPGQSPGAAFPPTAQQLGLQPVWPAGGELDLAEYLWRYASPANGVIQSTLHQPRPNGAGNSDTYEFVRVYPVNGVAAYHLYQLQWTADTIAFAVDDAVVMTCSRALLACTPTDPASPGAPAGTVWPYGVSRRAYYLILNLAIGGNAGITNGDNRLVPAGYDETLKVAYVRYLTP